MSTMSLARRRIDIQSLTNPAPPDDDWRRNLPAESGLRASLTGTSPPRNKVVWDTPPVAVRKVDEDYEADGDDGQVEVVPGEEDEHPSEDNESSRSASASCTRSPSSSPKMSAPTGRWAWPRIPNPHPSLLSAAQSLPAEIGPVRSRRDRDMSARPTVTLPPQRTRTAAPVPVEGLTKKSRGRRVPTAVNAVADGDVVFQAGKDGDKLTRMFACTVDGCGRRFDRGENLKRHIRSIHTNEQPPLLSSYHTSDKIYTTRSRSHDDPPPALPPAIRHSPQARSRTPNLSLGITGLTVASDPNSAGTHAFNSGLNSQTMFHPNYLNAPPQNSQIQGKSPVQQNGGFTFDMPTTQNSTSGHRRKRSVSGEPRTESPTRPNTGSGDSFDLGKQREVQAAKRQRGIGVDDKESPKEATLGTAGQRMLTLSITGSASDQPTVQVIGHTMPLVTIVKHLVNQGCADVSSQLKNIDEHSRYSGSLSDVYQARWPDGSLVAVKCLRALTNSDVPPGKLLKHTARELYTWSRASHPNILKLHGLAMVRGKLAMIAPWMEYCSLLAYIRARPQVDRCRLCARVAAGLSYMHGLGLVHGDVKGNNVVVSEDGTPKLTDFGSTTMAQEFAIAFTATQTVNYSARWAAPELFRSQSPRFESDVYAFAKTVLEALTGDIPHEELQSDLAITLHVGLEGKLPIRPVDHIPSQSKKGDELWDMLARCWDVEPTKRPIIREVCEFMSDMTKEDLKVLE